jgi:hypothetical protein
MAPRYVLRWHKRTSWRRRGTELGAIDLGAELHSIQKTFLAQLVKYKALNLVVVGWSPTVGVFLILFVFVTYLFFLLSIFFVYVVDLSVLIYFSSSFIFVTDLFIRLDFFYPASTTAVYAVNSKIYHPWDKYIMSILLFSAEEKR